MLKTYKGLLSVMCSLFLATAISLPLTAQTSTSGSNQNLSNPNQSGQTQGNQDLNGQDRRVSIPPQTSRLRHNPTNTTRI